MGSVQAAVKRGDLRLVQIGEGKDGEPVMAVERGSLDAWAPNPRRQAARRG